MGEKLQIDPERKLEFGNNLRNLRISKGFTQRELGLYSGVNHSLINRIENGDTSPHLITARRIAKGLRLNPDERLSFYEAGSEFENTTSAQDEVFIPDQNIITSAIIREIKE